MMRGRLRTSGRLKVARGRRLRRLHRPDPDANRIEPGFDGDWMPTREALDRLGDNGAPILVMLRDRRLEARAGAVMFGTIGDPDPRGRYHTTVLNSIVPDAFWQQCCEPGASHLNWVAGCFEGRSGYLNMAVEAVQLRRSQFNLAFPPPVTRQAATTVQPVAADAAGAGKGDRRPVSVKEWKAWADQYRRDHVPLPDVGRVILQDARAVFGERITQQRVRDTFGGGKPGPRRL